MPESRLVPFRGRRHVLAGDLLLVDHSAICCRYRSCQTRTCPIASFSCLKFSPNRSDLFSLNSRMTSFRASISAPQLISTTVLPSSSNKNSFNKRVSTSQPIIVVLVRLVRSTVGFIHAVVTVLARQPDLTYERRFVLMGRAPLRPRPISWRRLLPSTLPSPSVPRRQ